mmetsp:Transcript_8666/g.22765  ORF Transcript_8666/g.22765 Transcript_8666/m.22765 type:complete len:90 (+) Transcript_8666:185-454(+)
MSVTALVDQRIVRIREELGRTDLKQDERDELEKALMRFERLKRRRVENAVNKCSAQVSRDEICSVVQKDGEAKENDVYTKKVIEKYPSY